MRTSVDLDYLHERVILRHHESSISSLDEEGGVFGSYMSVFEANDIANGNQTSNKTDIDKIAAPFGATKQFEMDGEFDAILHNARELILDG